MAKERTWKKRYDKIKAIARDISHDRIKEIKVDSTEIWHCINFFNCIEEVFDEKFLFLKDEEKVKNKKEEVRKVENLKTDILWLKENQENIREINLTVKEDDGTYKEVKIIKEGIKNG